jgi:TolA-binding protein
MKKGRTLFLLLLLALSLPLTAQQNNGGSSGNTGAAGVETEMRKGLDLFKQGNYNEALYVFREITLESLFSDYHGSSYFWIAKCYLALGNLDLAEENLDFFLGDFAGHPFHEEGLYQKGRILFLKKKYQEGIGVFYDFIERWPESDFTANAYFWIAESLFLLGHYKEAETLFHLVVSDYPASFKVEAARYRLSLIDIFDREKVLLDLLKVSHEEYINSLDDFQRRERTYEQALSVYQRQILTLTETLEEERKAAALAASRPQIEPPAAIPEAGDAGMSENLLKLVDLKNRVLTLKEFYVDLMEKQYQEGM